MEELINIYNKHKAIIMYVFWGGITTVINIAVYVCLYNLLGIKSDISNIISWFITVSVAYITNKIWVFESKITTIRILVYEIISFFACRIATGIIDIVIMHIAVEVMHYPGIIFKILSNIIVIVLNYTTSKLFIFKHRSD